MRAARLRRTIDVQRVRREGVSRSDRVFHVSAITRQNAGTRVAISVSARLGGAVRRNRARRRTRAVFDRIVPRIADGADLLVSVRQAAIDAPFVELERSAETLLAELGVLGSGR